MSDIISSKLILDLNIDNNGYNFATSINDAIIKAEDELAILNETIETLDKITPNCDRVDYGLAASSGAICGIIDIFLYNETKEITDKWFEDIIKKFAKLNHQNHHNFENTSSAIHFLEEKYKIPYDQTNFKKVGSDLSPKNHHFESLAHNPSLIGLFFSILDQFSNTSHFVINGELELVDNKWILKGENFSSKIFYGFVNWLGHLISDVGGSSGSASKGNRGMGLPSPLWTWVNDIIVLKTKLGIPVSELDKDLNDLAIKIFKQGYDTRFQVAQAIPVFLNDVFVRMIYSIRRLFAYYKNTQIENRSAKLLWNKCEPFSNSTVKRMLTVAHGTFCLIDAGDAIARGFIKGRSIFNTIEFVIRLNIVGVGRLAISLYGEGVRGIEYYNKSKENKFINNEKVIINDYIQGLKLLAEIYDDKDLLNFVDDFENSELYIETLNKTERLAIKRGVSDKRILKNKSEIDNYFGGN